MPVGFARGASVPSATTTKRPIGTRGANLAIAAIARIRAALAVVAARGDGMATRNAELVEFAIGFAAEVLAAVVPGG